MSDTGFKDTTSHTRKKRKRTAQACGPCRSRKQKCDGAHPICNPCRELGRTCSYPLGSQPLPQGKTVVDASYLGDLEAMARLYRLSNPNSAQTVHEVDRSSDVPTPEASLDHPRVLDQPHDWAMPPNLSMNFSDDTSVVPYPASIPKVADLSPFHDSGLSGLSVDLDHPISDTVNSSEKERFKVPTSEVQLENDLSIGNVSGEPAEREMDGMGMFPNIIPSSSSRLQIQTPSPLALSQLVGISPDFEYYGETSGVRFHAVLLDKLLLDYQCLIGCEDPMGQRRGSDWPRAAFLGLPFESDPGYRPFKIEMSDLPTVQVAQRIWGIFGTDVHCLYPFISVDMLRRSYVALMGALSKSNAAIGDPVYEPLLALHFSVFALVKAIAPNQLDGLPSQAHSLALQLLRRNQDWAQSTIKVQALLHGVLLLQSVDCPNHSWSLLGNAIRTAYSIGLHQSANLLNLPPLDRETRCRAWWGCFTLDRLLSVTIGRPSAITATDPHFPMPQPLWGDQPSSLVFFEESIRLYQALSELATRPPTMTAPLHTDAQTVEAALNATATLELAYAKWSDNVTPELQVTDINQLNHPLATACSLRGTTMRLLLHRPVLLAHIREQVSPSQTSAVDEGKRERALAEKKRQQAIGVSLGAIIETAVYTVHLLDMGTGVQIHPPWYQLFYAMNAFMSLVATFLIDLTKWSPYIQTPSSDIVQSLRTVHKIIDDLQRTSHRPASKRALALVRVVLRVLRIDVESANYDTTVPLFDNGGSLDALPQLALEELYQLLDLTTGQRASEMPTSDWLGMFGSSG